MSEFTDESAIRRLLAEYCHAYDDGRADDFAELFTADATFTVFGTTRHGRTEIREHVGAWDPNTPPGQHVTYNTVIDLHGDRAWAWTDFLYLQQADDGYRVSTAGRYHDELLRGPDRWRFHARTIRFLGDGPTPGA